MSRDKIVDEAIKIAAREGRAPEQADFMTAAVLNQDSMTAEERRWLQADLRAAELGTSTESMGYDDETEYLDWDDDPDEEWGQSDPVRDYEYGQERCPDCGKDDFFCTCPIIEDEKTFVVVVDCSLEWYEFDLDVLESKVQTTQKDFLEKHNKECGCKNPKVSVTEN